MAGVEYVRQGSGEPLLLVHGLGGDRITWKPVLDGLAHDFDVIAVDLPGFGASPALPSDVRPTPRALAEVLAGLLDELGIDSAHVAGNSLGGYLALRLAARGRARTVVALAPAGGWAAGDDGYLETLDHFTGLQPAIERAAPHAEQLMATPEGRRRAAAFMAESWEHIPPELLAHQIRGAAACAGLRALDAHARRHGWPLDAEQVRCPVRIVWGTADRILPWPRAAERYRATFPRADWVELEGVGHGAQLDVPLPAAQLILGFTVP